MLVDEGSDFLCMSLDNLIKLTLSVPGVDHTVGTSRVAGTFGIKCSTRESGYLASSTKSSLSVESLGGISGVPELKLLEANSDESEVVSFLGPGNVMNLIFSAFDVEKLLVPLDVVDNNMMIIVEVDASDVSLAGGDRDTSDAS
jgi:hypothetical protein